MQSLPAFETLQVTENLVGITLTLNRPHVRNAINGTMLTELSAALQWLRDTPSIRLLILQGAGGHFCAGGDLSDMLAAAQAYEAGQQDAFHQLNYRYGLLLLEVLRLPCTTMTILEGSVMGGGLGLAAVADLCLAKSSAQLAMPEVSLGLPPAQIAPFVAARIGLSKTRRLALSARKLSAHQALELGLIDQLAEDELAFRKIFTEELAAINRCSPQALRATKLLLLEQSPFGPARQAECDAHLQRAATVFSHAVTRGDGPEGTRAFMEKRLPQWVVRATEGQQP
jgi:isohexenylglutaconyl-CoA hydratase